MYVDSETPTCTVKWSPSPSVAADDVRPLGQLADGRKRRPMVTIKMTHYA